MGQYTGLYKEYWNAIYQFNKYLKKKNYLLIIIYYMSKLFIFINILIKFKQVA